MIATIPRKLRIVNVDRYGFLGRDHHPEPEDIGKVVSVKKAERFFDDLDEEPYLMFTCFDGDGQTLELMDFEVVEHQ